MKFASWALEQVKARGPSDELAQVKIQALVDALGALRGKAGAQVFGMAADRIEPEGRRDVESSIISALTRWKAHFQAAGDPVSLLELDEVGKTFDLADLRRSGRAPLRCDPLGTKDGLSREWLSRLSRLEQAKAGKRQLQLAAIQYTEADDERAHQVTFGSPDQKALYECALRYEAEHEAPFPRELAAFWSISDGIDVDGDPVLRSIAQWAWDAGDRGLCIGCGGDVQGSLILERPPRKKGLLGAKVVDVDDDGVERARYRDFAGFIDALLGR